MGRGCLGGGQQPDRVKGFFRYREGRDVESFGGVDVHGVDVGSLQALDLLDGLNQKPVF